jgi:hypothetical protein
MARWIPRPQGTAENKDVAAVAADETDAAEARIPGVAAAVADTIALRRFVSCVLRESTVNP